MINPEITPVVIYIMLLFVGGALLLSGVKRLSSWVFFFGLTLEFIGLLFVPDNPGTPFFVLEAALFVGLAVSFLSIKYFRVRKYNLEKFEKLTRDAAPALSREFMIWCLERNNVHKGVVGYIEKRSTEMYVGIVNKVYDELEGVENGQRDPSE